MYCPEHGAQPVPEDQLPVLLPEDVDFAPTGVSPLQSHADFLEGQLPGRGAEARRETDTWTPSSTRPGISCATARRTTTRGLGSEAVAHWLPVDLYTGGAEHAVLHLMYSRFFVKALRDMGLSFDEPSWRCATRARSAGADHQRMSKSRGNVVNPTT